MQNNQINPPGQDATKVTTILMVINFKKPFTDEQLKDIIQISQSNQKNFIEIQPRKSQKNKVQLRLKFEPSAQIYSAIGKIINIFNKEKTNQLDFNSNLSSVDLSIDMPRSNQKQLEMLSKILESFLSKVQKFKFQCESEVNEKQLKLIIIILSQLREVDRFEFICSDRLVLKEQNADTELCSALEKIIQNATIFNFNNSQASEKGYNGHEISNIPGLISKSVALAKNLKEMSLSFNYVGWIKIKKNRHKFILSHFLKNIIINLQFWPTALTKIEMNLNRLVCYNQNISSLDVSNFLKQFTILISRQEQLKELSLDLAGIGFNTYLDVYELCELTQYLKSVNKLSLDISGHVNLCEDNWNKFFSGISNIQNLTYLNLSVEYWRDFYNNQLTSQQQYDVVNTFIDNLLKNHKNNLQFLHFNVEDWSFLPTVNQIDLLKKISGFEVLNNFRLIFWKTKNEAYYDLIKQAQDYYQSLKYLTVGIGLAQNSIINSSIIEEIEKVQSENQKIITEIAIRQLLEEGLLDSDKQQELLEKNSKKITEPLQNNIKYLTKIKQDSLTHLQVLYLPDKLVEKLSLNSQYLNQIKPKLLSTIPQTQQYFAQQAQYQQRMNYYQYNDFDDDDGYYDEYDQSDIY